MPQPMSDLGRLADSAVLVRRPGRKRARAVGAREAYLVYGN
jgi:hypothetical protein